MGNWFGVGDVAGEGSNSAWPGDICSGLLETDPQSDTPFAQPPLRTVMAPYSRHGGSDQGRMAGASRADDEEHANRRVDALLAAL